MKENEELRIKNLIVNFIRQNMAFVGDENKIDETIRDLVEGLYEILYPTESSSEDGMAVAA